MVSVYDSERACFTEELQLCIMNLVSSGVGVHHITEVVTEVAKLCHRKLDKLPSVRTINRISDQRLAAAHYHISSTVSNKQFTTLMSDETRKFGDCFEMFGLRDDDGKQWVLGLRDMQNKASQSCLDTLITICNDIDTVSKSHKVKQIFWNIKNTMSVRAASEKHFHQLLEEYRTDILPQEFSNWLELSAEEQTSLTKLNNFYCGLHILVNFA